MQANIVALDLSLTGTGWAALEFDGSISTGKITTRAAGCERIDYVLGQVTRLCTAPLVAMEGPSYASFMAMQHEGAGLWWQVRMMLHRGGIDVAVISPHSLQKYATGKGVADKHAVIAEAARRFPNVPIHSGDEADALWLLAMCAERYGRPLADMPAVNRSAIHAITPAKKGKPAHPAIGWPERAPWEPAHV